MIFRALAATLWIAGLVCQAQAQAPASEQLQLIYQPWAKYCMKGQDADAKQVCFIQKDGRTDSGETVVAVVIIEPDGDPKKLLRVTIPLGMALVQGTRIVIDNNHFDSAPFVACFKNGCMADYALKPEWVAAMKKGQNLFVQAIQVNGSPVTLPLGLAEFAKAYDGPPTDPEIFEENQIKLQEELRARAVKNGGK